MGMRNGLEHSTSEPHKSRRDDQRLHPTRLNGTVTCLISHATSTWDILHGLSRSLPVRTYTAQHLSCSAPARPAYRAQSPPPSAPSHAPPCAACTRHPAWWSPPPVPPSSHPAPPSPPWHSPPLPPETARTHTSPPKPDQGRCPGTGGHQEAASQSCPSSAWTLRFSTKRISTLPRLTRSMKTASQASGMWR